MDALAVLVVHGDYRLAQKLCLNSQLYTLHRGQLRTKGLLALQIVVGLRGHWPFIRHLKIPIACCDRQFRAREESMKLLDSRLFLGHWIRASLPKEVLTFPNWQNYNETE